MIILFLLIKKDSWSFFYFINIDNIFYSGKDTGQRAAKYVRERKANALPSQGKLKEAWL